MASHSQPPFRYASAANQPLFGHADLPSIRLNRFAARLAWIRTLNTLILQLGVPFSRFSLWQLAHYRLKLSSAFILTITQLRPVPKGSAEAASGRSKWVSKLVVQYKGSSMKACPKGWHGFSRDESGQRPFNEIENSKPTPLAWPWFFQWVFQRR